MGNYGLGLGLELIEYLLNKHVLLLYFDFAYLSVKTFKCSFHKNLNLGCGCLGKSGFSRLE